MKCQRCGAELLDTDTFCVKCGWRTGKMSGLWRDFERRNEILSQMRSCG